MYDVGHTISEAVYIAARPFYQRYTEMTDFKGKGERFIPRLAISVALLAYLSSQQVRPIYDFLPLAMSEGSISLSLALLAAGQS
jgi:hypothetical protein